MNLRGNYKWLHVFDVFRLHLKNFDPNVDGIVDSDIVVTGWKFGPKTSQARQQQLEGFLGKYVNSVKSDNPGKRLVFPVPH